MDNYRFEVSGEVKIKEIEGNNGLKPCNFQNTNQNSFGGRLKEKILEILIIKLAKLIVGIIITCIIVITIYIFYGLFLSEESYLLELLFILHKRVTYSILIFLSIVEAIYLINGLVNKIKFTKLIVHVLLSLSLFLFLFVINLGIYEKIVGLKLTTIKIEEPKNSSRISSPITEVRVFVRKIEWPIYLIVEVHQGTLWVQTKRHLRHNQFKDTFTEGVRLGEWYIGIDETFKILAIATKEDLKIGPLERIPPDSIHSNTVNVRRVR